LHDVIVFVYVTGPSVATPALYTTVGNANRVQPDDTSGSSYVLQLEEKDIHNA
jgi:hypothetical protein